MKFTKVRSSSRSTVNEIRILIRILSGRQTMFPTFGHASLIPFSPVQNQNLTNQFAGNRRGNLQQYIYGITRIICTRTIYPYQWSSMWVHADHSRYKNQYYDEFHYNLNNIQLR